MSEDLPKVLGVRVDSLSLWLEIYVRDPAASVRCHTHSGRQIRSDPPFESHKRKSPLARAFHDL